MRSALEGESEKELNLIYLWGSELSLSTPPFEKNFQKIEVVVELRSPCRGSHQSNLQVSIRHRQYHQEPRMVRIPQCVLASKHDLNNE
jgi:hypothetical protein